MVFANYMFSQLLGTRVMLIEIIPYNGLLSNAFSWITYIFISIKIYLYIRNRFKGLDLIDRVPDLFGMRFVTLYRRQGSRPFP